MYIKWTLKMYFYILCLVSEERRLEVGVMESEKCGRRE